MFGFWTNFRDAKWLVLILTLRMMVCGEAHISTAEREREREKERERENRPKSETTQALHVSHSSGSVG